MIAPVEIPINPEVLIWARISIAQSKNQKSTANGKSDQQKRGWQYVEALEKKYLESGQKKASSSSKGHREGHESKQIVDETSKIVDVNNKVETEVSVPTNTNSTVKNMDFTSKLVGDLKKKRDKSVAEMKRKTTALYERSLMRRKNVGKSETKDQDGPDESELSSTDDDEEQNQDGEKILAKAEGAVLAAKRMVQQLNEMKDGH